MPTPVSRMDLSFILNADSDEPLTDENTVQTPPSMNLPLESPSSSSSSSSACSASLLPPTSPVTPSSPSQSPFSTSSPSPHSDKRFACEKERNAAAAARDGTLTAELLYDIVQLATNSTKLFVSAPVLPRTSPKQKRCTAVYRIDKRSGLLSRRADMDALVRIVGDNYEPGRKLRRFACFCHKWYNKREHLNRHVQLVHHNARPYRCDMCNVAFGTKQNMDVHMNTNKHKRTGRVSWPSIQRQSQW